MEMLKKLLISRGVQIGDLSLQNWTDVAIANATEALRRPTSSATTSREFVNLTEADAWWNRIEEHHDELDTTGLFGTYPIRTPPSAFGRSPAASLITALAMTNATESSLPEALTAEAFLINVSCVHMAGCDFHEHMLISSPILSVDFDSLHPFTSTYRDDGAWLTWVLSASIGPTIHLVASKMLACASTRACGSLCGLCNQSRGGAVMRDSDPVDIVRAAERALVGGADASVDVVLCLQTAACIDDVAERAASDLESFVVSATADVGLLADSNQKLWAYARIEMESNASFADRRETRSDAARAHQNAVGSKTVPEWVRPHTIEHGRRLDDRTSETLNGDFGDNETRFIEWIRSLTPSELQLFIASHNSATLLQSNASSLQEISKSHLQFVQTWARVGAHVGEKPKRMGVCMDPQFVNRTISCRVHLVLVGKAIGHLRNEATNNGRRQRRRRASNEPELRDHINLKLAEACCARFPNGTERCGEAYCEHHIAREVTKRMASVIKKMTADGHPSASKIGPDVHAIIENVLLPELHPDFECREINMSSLHGGGPTRTECTARSLLKHASKRYGVDGDTIERKMQEFGISAGYSMQKIQSVTGMFAEVRTTGNKLQQRAANAPKAKAAANAARLLREATKRSKSSSSSNGGGRRMKEDDDDDKTTRTTTTPGMKHAERRRRKLEDARSAMSDDDLAKTLAATRGTDVEDGHNRHGFAHSAAKVKENRASLKNATVDVENSFARLEKVAHKARLEQMALRRRQHVGSDFKMDKTPEAMTFHRDNFWQHVVNPVLATEIIQADEGSLTSRFSSGVQKLSQISQRWSQMHVDANRIQIERRRRRRQLSSDDSKKYAGFFYDKLDAEQLKREDERVLKILSKPGGVVMDESKVRADLKRAVRSRIPEIKADHGLAFVHDLVDWNTAADEWTRLHAVFEKRNRMRIEGRQMDEILRDAPSGYALLDDGERFGFSKAGDALRRLWHRRVDRTDEHFVAHVRSQSDRAGKHQPARHGRLRKLTEGFLGPTLAVPYAFVDTVVYSTSGALFVPSTKEDIFTSTIRYVVYSTIGCYLTEPHLTTASSSINNPDDPSESPDGDTMKVFRPGETFLCFPSVPFILPRMPTWREFTKSEGIDYAELQYEEFCTSKGFQEKARDFFEDTLGMGVKSSTARWLGVPGALRGAEAIDSIKNFVDSAQADEGEWVIG